MDNDGKVSRHRRLQFQYSVPEEVFEFIEEEAGRALRDRLERVAEIQRHLDD